MAREAEAPIRVVIVDDHPMIRDGTATFLRNTGDIQVVGVAGDGQSGLDLVLNQRPDVLMLDLRLPDIPGVEVARRVRRELPGVSIVVMTGYDYQAYRRELGRMGIAAVLGKTASGDEIASAVRAAVARAESDADAAPTTLPTLSEGLTVREYQILEMLAGGRRNPEIAKSLFVSVKTVEFHVSNLLSKLDARSRMEAVLRAQERGLLSPHLLPPEAEPLQSRGLSGAPADGAP